MIERNIANGNIRTDRLKKINNVEEYFKNLATGSTQFPKANTPLNTYGDEFISYPYTPVHNNSIILITPNLSYASSTSPNWVSSAVFLNSNAAEEGSMISYCAFLDQPSHLIYTTKSINTSRDIITIKIRIGGNNLTTTITFNPFLAGKTTSSLLIEEFLII